MRRFRSAIHQGFECPHFHVLVLDGGYAELDDGTLTLLRANGPRPAPRPSDPSPVRGSAASPFGFGTADGVEDTAPTPAELRAIEDRVEARFGQWLKRNGFLDEEGPEEQELDGWWTAAASDPSGVLAPVGARRSSRWEVDARVRVAAGDEQARLQLCLYAARPPFAEAQLEVLDEDRVH